MAADNLDEVLEVLVVLEAPVFLFASGLVDALEAILDDELTDLRGRALAVARDVGEHDTHLDLGRSQG